MPIGRRHREKQRLTTLIQAFRGNLSKIAADMTKTEGKRVTRQALSNRLARLELLPLAATARDRGAISGQRPTAKEPTAKERAAFLLALVETDSDEAAAARLGMKRRTFYRRKGDLGITREDVERARQRRSAG